MFQLLSGNAGAEMEDTEQVRQLVCTRIGEIENQVKCLQALRKSLLEKAYEVQVYLTFLSTKSLIAPKKHE